MNEGLGSVSVKSRWENINYWIWLRGIWVFASLYSFSFRVHVSWMIKCGLEHSGL